jgi:hypothetical protein
VNIYYLLFIGVDATGGALLTLDAANSATNVGHYAPVPVPVARIVESPRFDDPPNYRAPKILPARQSDTAPLSSLAQCGYWLNQVGRRAS